MAVAPASRANPSQDASTPGARPRDAARRSPNLVLITLDTVRADALGVYGQQRPTTPEMDRLAREGVLFEQVSTSQPETLPSHSTIFTGKWPYAHGVRANGGFVLSERNITLAEVLRDAGYVTRAEVAALVLRKETQITQGFDYYRGAESPGVELKQIRYAKGPVRDETKPTRIAADITRSAIEFVRESQAREFFLWVHYFDAHVPQSPPPLFVHKIKGSPYHGEVASIDSQVGRLILELERLGLRDDTLVVITADHGEGLGDHGEVSHSFFLYQSTMRVPLILWGPRTLPTGRRIASPVRTADIAPTVLALLGKPPLADIQGVSLVPLLSGEAEDLALAGYGESTRFAATFSMPTLRFIRDGRWKYIHKVNPELYDLEIDPGELVNLASDRPLVVERLRADLSALLAAAPERPADSQSEIDAETAENLIALGYVARSPLIEVHDDVESLALDSATGDPVDRIEDVERVTIATGLLLRNMYEEALEHLEPIARKPKPGVYLLGLQASALMGLERVEEAVAVLRRAREIEPDDLETLRSLAAALAASGGGQEAVKILYDLLSKVPCNEPIHADLGVLLRQQKRYADLIESMAAGANACPEMATHLNNYAWALATLPDPALRNGTRAVELIESAIAASPEQNPAYLDTLAAARAEVGDFVGAKAAASQALGLLRELHVPEEVLHDVEGHLESIAAGRPVRDP